MADLNQEDLNTSPLFGTLNNMFETADGATNEVATDSATFGQLIVALAVLLLAVIVISLIFKIPQKMAAGFGSIMKSFKM